MISFDEIAEESKASIQKEDLKILLPIIAKIQPKNILEIGMHQGYSMEVWRKAFNPEHLVGLEISVPTQESYTEEGFLWNTDSHKPTPIGINNIDFLFIDGDHSEAGVRQDFEMYSPLVRKGGIIVLHDVVYTSTDENAPVMVKPLWEELKLKYPYVEIKTANSTGMGVIWI
jgi:predicted O-methyltransferase YrrM